MKKAFVLFALSFIALSACQKTSNSSNLPTTYMVQGVTDVTLGGDSASTLDLSYYAGYVGPIQETVTFSLADLPPHVIVDTTLHSINTGVPPFTFSFRLVNMDTIATGKHTIKLMCKGSVTGEKYYTFTLIVLPKTPPVHCDTTVAGTWDNCTEFCSGGTYIDVVNIDGSMLNRVHFTNFQGYGIDVYADLDCATGNFTIPYQSIGSGTGAVWGTGTFANKFISYSVTDSTSLGTISCAGSMSRP